MMFALIFALFGVLMWAAAGVLVYFRRRQVRKTGLMRDTETTPAAGVAALAAGTPVEVKGTLRCEEPLTSEMAGRRCAYYVSRVEDPSGTVGVSGEGAEVDALEVTNRFEEGEGGESGLTIGGVTINMGEGERTIGYRHAESVLPVDAPVYVLGVVREDGRIGPLDHGGERGGFLISHRSEEELGKDYKRDALVLGLVAAGLFVFGAVFLAVGFGAGLLAAGAEHVALGVAHY